MSDGSIGQMHGDAVPYIWVRHFRQIALLTHIQ